MPINEKDIKEAMNRRLSVLESTPESRRKIIERLKNEQPNITVPEGFDERQNKLLDHLIGRQNNPNKLSN